MDTVPDKDTIEYVEWLIQKASPKSDAPMVVQWLPFVKDLVGQVKQLRTEYEVLRLDYEKLKNERMKEVWAGQKQSRVE